MYIKTLWEGRKGSDLNRFEKAQETTRSVVLHNAPNSVTQPGTPFSVANMNKIEQGIYDAHEMVDLEKAERLADVNGLQTAIGEEINARELADAALQTIIDIILSLIPNQANPTNQLTDKNFVNFSINNLAAFYVVPDAVGLHRWSSFTALQAGPWYSGGQPRQPTQNDYAAFLNIDPAIGPVNSEWSALFNNGQWYPKWKLNDTPFTAAQIAAINSGITAEIVTKANSAYQKPSDGIPKSDLNNAVQTSLNKADSALQPGSTANIPEATTSQKGVVQLNNTVNSTSTTQAATANAVKTVNDAKYTKPSSGIPKSDMDSSVQASLSKADSAMQSITLPDATTSQKGVATLGASGGAARYGQKGDAGLGNVTNDAQVKATEKGAVNGVATLKANGKVTDSQMQKWVPDWANTNQTNRWSAGSTSYWDATGDGWCYISLDQASFNKLTITIDGYVVINGMWNSANGSIGPFLLPVLSGQRIAFKSDVNIAGGFTQSPFTHYTGGTKWSGCYFIPGKWV